MYATRTVTEITPEMWPLCERVIAYFKDKRGNSMEQAAAVLGVARSTLYGAMHRFSTGGEQRDEAKTKSYASRRMPTRFIALTRVFFHDLKREKIWPTLDLIMKKHKEYCQSLGKAVPFSRTTLWRVMVFHLKMRVKKTRVNKKEVREQKQVVDQRFAYLRRIYQLQRAGRPIFYMDETWGVWSVR